MDVVEKDWGKVLTFFSGYKMVGDRTVVSEGVLIVNPHGIIPLHLHTSEAEEYVPQTPPGKGKKGVKVLVIPENEVQWLKPEDVKDELKSLRPIPAGDAILCKKGSAHALLNDSDETVTVVFIKFNT